MRHMRASRSVTTVGAGIALTLAALLACGGLLAPGGVSAAQPTRSPYVEGRHVYDYGHRMSSAALSRAETLAARIEAEGGGRTVVYTADVMELPSQADLAAAWDVTGLLLTGWDDFGYSKVGATLNSRLPAGTEKFIDSTSSMLTSFESWTVSNLARVDGLLNGRHVFDGPGVLDAASLTHAEASADALSAKIGIPVYVDIAIGEAGDPRSTAYWNSDLNAGLGTSLVIALAVSGEQIGGHVEAATAYDESYVTSGPWSGDFLWTETAPRGDVQAELLRLIDAVGTPIDPVEVLNSVVDETRAWAASETNQRYSIGGVLIALLVLIVFVMDRRRRRRDAGYGDDSVLLPAPPADMTPALAAIVTAPLDTTRAVTTALLDLAAHGFIAFYQAETPLGQTGAIKVISGVGNGGHGTSAHAPAIDRPLGTAETRLLEGLRGAAHGGAGLAGSDFAELRPLFEQTGEQLERIAGERGWLRSAGAIRVVGLDRGRPHAPCRRGGGRVHAAADSRGRAGSGRADHPAAGHANAAADSNSGRADDHRHGGRVSPHAQDGPQRRSRKDAAVAGKRGGGRALGLCLGTPGRSAGVRRRQCRDLARGHRRGGPRLRRLISGRIALDVVDARRLVLARPCPAGGPGHGRDRQHARRPWAGHRVAVGQIIRSTRWPRRPQRIGPPAANGHSGMRLTRPARAPSGGSCGEGRLRRHY